MLKELLSFYWGLFSLMLWKPVWMNSEAPEAQHFHRRRFTTDYRLRQKLVEKIWLFAALLLLCFPSLPLAIAGVLFATFLSFCILDESGQ
jgi:hypothetical protein